MKKLYAILLLLIPIFAFAQKKVDLDRFSFTAQFRSLPKVRLDSSYRTYNVEVQSTRMMQPFLQDLSPEKSVVIEGWRMLPQDGHLSIEVKFEDLLPESVSVKERVENIKNKSGQITGTKTFYYQEVIYSFAATATIMDYKGIHVMDELLADRRNKQVYRSPEFAINKMAEGYFIINSFTITSELYRKCVTQAMRNLNEQVNDNFGFREVTVNDYMWIVDTRKHPEYTAHRQAFQKFNDALFGMSANKSPEGLREQLKPVIDYFERVKRNYPSTSKHDRKMKYASYFNLAVLYYYLDDPQSMMREANGLVLNDYDARDGKALEQSAIRLKTMFEQANIHTRHFPIDPSNFKGPYEKNAVTIK